MRSLITPSTARNEQASRLNWMKSSTASKLWVKSIRVATTSWNRIAVVGTPLRDRRANMRSIGMSPPPPAGAPGADPHQGADRGNQPDADQRADDAAAEIAEYVLARNDGNVDLTSELGDRRGVEKQGVERDVEDDDDRCPDQQRARQAALRIVHLAGD